MTPTFRPTPWTALVLGLAVLALRPAPAQAQFGAIEAFARQVSDLSFFFNIGGVANADADLIDRDAGTVRAFAVELLFEVAEVTRPIPGARAAPPADSVRRVWTGMEVVRSEEGVDTIYRYEIVPVAPPPSPAETIWTMEIGIGYGQLQGYELADPTLDMKMSVRDLPSVTLYASYEPWGNYFGLRTGFMETSALQVVDASGESYSGNAEAFLFGALTGYAFALEDLWLFLESGYTLRNFPSVEWRGGGPLPAGIPRELNLSGWFVSLGLQFPFR